MDNRFRSLRRSTAYWEYHPWLDTHVHSVCTQEHPPQYEAVRTHMIIWMEEKKQRQKKKRKRKQTSKIISWTAFKYFSSSSWASVGGSGGMVWPHYKQHSKQKRKLNIKHKQEKTRRLLQQTSAAPETRAGQSSLGIIARTSSGLNSDSSTEILVGLIFIGKWSDVHPLLLHINKLCVSSLMFRKQQEKQNKKPSVSQSAFSGTIKIY